MDTMEDDIDIEEHDVLDNPQIRDMFLDIDQIKVEAVDDEDPTIEFEDYHNPQIDTNGAYGTVHENRPVIYYEDDLPEFSTKITLGSKPNKEKIYPEILYEEALHSETYVALEDWGLILQTSPCYCNECKILFATRNALDSHNMSTHSFLVEVENTRNVARKSTCDKMKNCHHCNKMFADDTALIKHLYELLPLRNNQTDLKLQGYQCPTCSCCYIDVREITTHMKLNHGIDKKPEVTMINFHCPFCGINSNSLKFYNMHVAKMHRPTFCKKIEKVNRKRPFCLDSTVKVKTEADSEGSPRRKIVKSDLYYRCSLFLLRNTPVPKSVLFVCEKCSVHFVSAYFASKHLFQCKNSKSQQCKECKRKIRLFDLSIHYAQHNLQTTKIKTYKISTELYKKVLCKCPQCEICFPDNSFWSHFPKCGSIESVVCEKCDLAISDPEHSLKHWKIKSFFVIQYVSLNDQPTELIPTSKAVGKSEKLQNRSVIRKKGFAQTLKRENALALIKSIGMPLKIENSVKRNNVNKLKNSVHMRSEGSKILHPKIKTEPQAFIQKRDGSTTLFYCSKCDCCFGLLRHGRHTSKEGGCTNDKKKVCRLCGLYISRMAPHIKLHKTMNLTLHDFNFVTAQADGARVPTLPKIPDYYRCSTCDVRYISEDEAREHSCETELKIAQICSCGKKFNHRAYTLHNQFHVYHNQATDSKIMPKLLVQYELMADMWNILFYCPYCKVCTNSYDKVVEHAQKHLNNLKSFDKIRICKPCGLNFECESFEKHKILHKGSVTKHSFKLLSFDYTELLHKEWFDMFKDITLEQQDYILSKSIYKRVRNVKMDCIKIGLHDSVTEYHCAQCKQNIQETDIYTHAHAKTCDKQTVSKNSGINSRIVIFNDASDQEFNKRLKVELKQEKKYNLYRCSKCTLCILSKYNTKYHNCSFVDKKRKYCKLCGQYFAYTSHHDKSHDKYKTLHKRNINIISFKPKATNKLKPPENCTKIRKYVVSVKNKLASQKVMIHKCKCGLHFTSKLTLKKHASVCGEAVSSEKCSKCGLLFPTDILVSHLCMHHSKKVKFVVENSHSKVYRCPDCELLFTNKKIMSLHKCSPKNGVECKVCNLVFHKTMIRKHKCDSVNIIEDPSMESIVYACKPCNLNFNNHYGFTRHKCRPNKMKIKAKPCDLCGLRFSRQSGALAVHKIRYHARKDYNFILLDPVTAERVIISGNSDESYDMASVNESGEE